MDNPWALNGGWNEREVLFDKAAVGTNMASQWVALAKHLRSDEYHNELHITSNGPWNRRTERGDVYMLEPLDAVEDGDDLIPVISAGVAANQSVKSVRLELFRESISSSIFQERLLRCIGEGLRANRSIESLCLRLPVSISLRPQTIAGLASAIAENKSISSIRLRMPDSYVSQFADALKSNTRLLNIVLDVQEGPHDFHGRMCELFDGVSCNSVLQSLEVHGAGIHHEYHPFEFILPVNDRVDAAVALAFSRLPFLQDFKASLYSHGTAVVRAMNAHPKLENVDVAVEGMESVQLLLQSKLRFLSVRMKGHSDSASMISVAEALQMNSTLNRLVLDFDMLILDAEESHGDILDVASENADAEGRRTVEEAFDTAVRFHRSLESLSLFTLANTSVSRLAVAIATAMEQNQGIRSLTLDLGNEYEGVPRHDLHTNEMAVLDAIKRALSKNTSLLEIHGDPNRRWYKTCDEVTSMLQRNRVVLELAEVWRLVAFVAWYGSDILLRMVVASMGKLAFCQRVFSFMLPTDIACAFQAKSATRTKSCHVSWWNEEGVEEQKSSEADSGPESQIQASKAENTAEENAALAEVLLRSRICEDVAVTVFEVTCHARSPELARVLSESPRLADCRAFVTEAGCELQPQWAFGGWVLVPATKHQLEEAGIQLDHKKILARSCDMKAIEEELKSVSRNKRPRFKSGWVAAEYSDAGHGAGCNDTSREYMQPSPDMNQMTGSNGIDMDTGSVDYIAVIKNTFLNFYSVEARDEVLDSKTVHSDPCEHSGLKQPRNPRLSSGTI